MAAAPAPWTARAAIRGRQCRRKAAGQRGDREDAEAGEVDAPAAEAIGERAGAEQQRCERQRVGVDDPLQAEKLAPSSEAMSGNATVTIVTSTSSMNVPRQIAASGAISRAN